jgi:hypothetical protein
MSSGKVRITYEVVTPESAEEGDAAERGWIDEDGTDYTVEDAIQLLQGKEPSSSHFHPGVWYSDIDGDVDLRTGAETRQSYHLDGFSEDEQRAIFDGVRRR